MRKEGTGRGGSETGAETEPTTTFGVVEKATIASAGNNRAYSDGGYRKNEHGSSEGIRARSWGSFKKRPLCNGGG